MKSFNKIGSYWYINSNLIANFIKNNTAENDELIEEIKKYILEQLVENKTITKSLLKKSSEEITESFFFPIQLGPDTTLIDIIISPNEILNYYSENKSELKRWQIKAYEKLNLYLSKEYQHKVYSRKKIAPNITYSDLLYILRLQPEEIDSLIKNDNFRGISGVEFYKLIREYLYDGYIIKDRLFEIFDVTEEEKNRIHQNIKKIDYQFKENIYAKKRFVESRNIADRFKLNDKIKNAVLKGMPKHFNKLQQTYYIYRRLCQLFVYDEDYYCYGYISAVDREAKKPVIDHDNIELLNDLDINSEVVCTEITMLFAKFLELLEIPYQIVDYHDNTNIDYKKSHMRVNFKVDDVIMEADAGHGLQYSDMSKEKVYGKVSNFKPKTETPLRIKTEVFKQLDEVNQYIEVTEEQLQFEDAIEIYENTYKANNNITIKERVSMLIEIIQKSKLKTMDLIDVISRIKKQMFTNCKNAGRIEIIINKKPKQQDKTYEIVLVIVYNENRDIDMLPETNKFIVVNSDKSIENLGFDEIRERFENGTYDFAGKSRRNIYKKWIGEDDTGYSHGFRA